MLPMEDLTKLAFTAHVAVIPLALALYGRFGDRTELVKKSLDGVNETLNYLKRQVAFDLARQLQPVFDQAGAKIVFSTILDSKGGPLTAEEITVSPIGSEGYLEAISRFVNETGTAVQDFRSLAELRLSWLAATRFLAWLLVGLIGWETLLLLAVSCIISATGDMPGRGVLALCSAPSFLLLLMLIAALWMTHFYHDRIQIIRMRHEQA